MENKIKKANKAGNKGSEETFIPFSRDPRNGIGY